MIYFIGARQMGLVKIGTTSMESPAARLNAMQTGSPDELILLATEPGGLRRESELHLHHRGSRVRGEWFRLTDHLRSQIEAAGGDLTGWQVLDPADAWLADIAERVRFSLDDLPRLSRLLDSLTLAARENDSHRPYSASVHLEELAVDALVLARHLADQQTGMALCG